MSRPEHIAPPEVFYNETEAKKYSENSRIMNIQAEMSERAIQLLGLPQEKSCLVYFNL
jgi:18S rRNA (guanine1575-N7)-methyltransferase